MYAEVLIEYSAKSIDKTFTYLIPPNLQGIIQVGMKVLVPFGPNTINGFITKINDTIEETYEIKEIIDIVDKYFCLNDELMQLGAYLQSKTLCTKITAYQTMLPSSLKVKEQKTNYSKYLTYIELNKPALDVYDYIETAIPELYEVIHCIIYRRSIDTAKKVVHSMRILMVVNSGIFKFMARCTRNCIVN